MRAKTEELLYLLLWTAEPLMRPTWRNLTESFEGWAYRNGLLRQLQRLEQRKWLERQPDSGRDRLHRLTDVGRLKALGGRDPEACWRRDWDRRWRLMLYDVPESRGSTRNKLRSSLRARGFGYLQNSVWITPDPLIEQRELLAEGHVDVESLVLLEARPCGGESDAQIVAGAWDFDSINKRYARYLEILARAPRGRVNTEAAAVSFHRWLKEERFAWMEALEHDPLLPKSLLPDSYAGRGAWEARQTVMHQSRNKLRYFLPRGTESRESSRQ